MRLILSLALVLLPISAHAFCGFYVGSAGDELVNKATQVVLFRDGDQTVLSMQNDYEGPPKKFALVVPVPVVLKKGDVKTLKRELFERVDTLAAPRLVEYWEQDPCAIPLATRGSGGLGMRGTGSGGGGFGRIAGRAVRVEAEFAVGEYDIVILSADDSTALDQWLRDNQYNIPPGAEAALRPYVASGMKFFVAKVNPKKVKFKAGRAVLSPLRMAYQSKDLRLPVRLGLLNASGPQDLVIHILARDQRYEGANYPNVTIPTNLEVTDDVRNRFGEFYAALFDKTLAKTPGAVVTEYAWQASQCDPCPGPVLTVADLTSLGADTLATTPAKFESLRLNDRAPTVEGSGLSSNAVRRVQRQRRNQFRYCAEKALAKAPQDVSGELSITFRLDADGRVTGTPKAVSSLPGKIGEACMLRVMKRVRFPKPEAGQSVGITFNWTATSQALRRGGPDPLMNFVLTRLHHRYTAEGLGEDLVFAPANAIQGGREVHAGGEPETGATESSFNNFQGRYAIRHVWKGPVTCDSPRFGMWGGPNGGSGKTRSANGMKPVKRDAVKLAKAVPAGIPELGITALGTKGKK